MVVFNVSEIVDSPVWGMEWCECVGEQAISVVSSALVGETDYVAHGAWVLSQVDCECPSCMEVSLVCEGACVGCRVGRVLGRAMCACFRI